VTFNQSGCECGIRKIYFRGTCWFFHFVFRPGCYNFIAFGDYRPACVHVFSIKDTVGSEIIFGWRLGREAKRDEVKTQEKKIPFHDEEFISKRYLKK
jgi:hypothetical protein